MAELAGQGLEAAAQPAGEAAASGAGKGAAQLGETAASAGGTFGADAPWGSIGAGASNFGDVAGAVGSGAGGWADVAGAGAGGIGADAAGTFGGGLSETIDTATGTVLGAGSSAVDPGAGAGLITSDAALTTGGSTPFGSGSGPLAGTNAAGQPLAAGGATAVSGGASIDPSAIASTPASGTSAASFGGLSGATASGTAGPADATSSWTDMLKKGLTNNPLGTAIAGAGLGYNILQGQKQTANQGALTQQAQQASANNTKLVDAGVAQVGTNQTNAAEIGNKGKELEQYLTTGKLPDQYTQQIDQAINDAKTTAISNAAKNGQPTDPTKNTSLAQQLAQIDNQRAGMTSKVAETLFQAGAGLTNTSANIGNASASSLLSGGQNAAGLAGQLYTTLTGIDTKQSEQTAKAIAALAQSLNAGGTQQKQAA